MVRQVGRRQPLHLQTKMSHSSISFQLFYPDLGIHHGTHLYSSLFALHGRENLGRIQLEGLAEEPLPTAISTRFDLEFHLFQEPESLSGNVFFSTDLFEPRLSNGMVAHLPERSCAGGLEQPQTQIASSFHLPTGLAAELRAMDLLDIKRTEYRARVQRG